MRLVPRREGPRLRTERFLKYPSFLSARVGEAARVEGLRAGADDYLVKPFSADEHVARVRTHLSLAQRRSEYAASMIKLHELSRQLTATDLASILAEVLEKRCRFKVRTSGTFDSMDAASRTLKVAVHKLASGSWATMQVSTSTASQ
jgi:DNA-binding response OmpR family regulator